MLGNNVSCEARFTAHIHLIERRQGMAISKIPRIGKFNFAIAVPPGDSIDTSQAVIVNDY